MRRSLPTAAPEVASASANPRERANVVEYQPYKDPNEKHYPREGDGYPGLNLTDERRERLRNLDVDPDAITADDIVWNVSRNASSHFFFLLRNVAKLQGEECARDLAQRLGYVVGRSNYQKMQHKYGVETLTPAMVALYEDTAHLLGGVEMATCVSEYRGNEWISHRRRCPFHTGAPKGAGHYCRFVNQGFAEAYKECDPSIAAIRYETSLMDGDDECTHVIAYREQGS